MTPPATDDHGKGALLQLADDDLAARARNKDIAAFEVLVERHEEKVYRLARRFVHTAEDAQEVLQETFLSAWRNLDQFEGNAQFGSWLYRIAANAALMLLRSQRRRPSVNFEDLPPAVLERVLVADPNEAAGQGYSEVEAGGGLSAGSDWWKRPDEQLQSAELRRHIQAAVDALPEPQRAVFLIRDVDGLSTEEAAAFLGLSVPTIKTRLHRARLTLRGAIGRYFEGVY
jgi:RNA polymerase sigma-70 factor (ECF subfamily)